MIHACKTVMEIYSDMIEFTTLAGYDDNDTIILLLMDTEGFFPIALRENKVTLRK